jgi:hypothetical protein
MNSIPPSHYIKKTVAMIILPEISGQSFVGLNGDAVYPYTLKCLLVSGFDPILDSLPLAHTQHSSLELQLLSIV